jgi:hypothetical protein
VVSAAKGHVPFATNAQHPNPMGRGPLAAETTKVHSNLFFEKYKKPNKLQNFDCFCALSVAALKNLFWFLCPNLTPVFLL